MGRGCPCHLAGRSLSVDDPAFEKKLLSWLAADSDATVGELAATAEGMAEVIRPALEVLVGRSFTDAGKVAWQRGDQAAANGIRRTGGIVRNTTHGEEVTLTLLEPDAWKRDVVIWLGDRGCASLADADGQHVATVARLLAAGAAVVGVDLFRQTEDPPARNRTVRSDREAAAYTYGYNHPLLAQRAHDVLTVLTALRTGQLGNFGRPRRVLLAAFGDTAPSAAAARAVAGAAIRTGRGCGSNDQIDRKECHAWNECDGSERGPDRSRVGWSLMPGNGMRTGWGCRRGPADHPADRDRRPAAAAVLRGRRRPHGRGSVADRPL